VINLPSQSPQRANLPQREISKRFDNQLISLSGEVSQAISRKPHQRARNIAMQQRLTGNMERFFLSQAHQMIHN
jgi:hypothetical protein